MKPTGIFPMRIVLLLALAFGLACGGNLLASDQDTFLKVGNIYYVWASKDAPVPFQNSGEASTATVKIILYGTNQWCWVEFDEYHISTKDPTKPVEIYKNRTWLNFAQVTAVSPGYEVDYAKTYTQGFKVVPYSGDGP
jgi:hypothetical protein